MRHARDFIGRLAERHPGVAEPLGRAHAEFTIVADHLDQLAKRFPCTFDQEAIEDEATIRTATGHLEEAKSAESAAIEALRTVLDLWPRGTG